MHDGDWSNEWYKEAKQRVEQEMFSGEYYEAVDDEDLLELSILETKWFNPVRLWKDRNVHPKGLHQGMDVRNGGDS